MRILLDECLPKKLRDGFPGHDVQTVPEAGWAGKSNGELLSLAKDHFDVFVTADQRLQFQINLSKLKITILVLYADDLQLESLLRLMPMAQRMLGKKRAGRIVHVKG
jgi:predicted nuclease of predicted toxin-antitoxin system